MGFLTVLKNLDKIKANIDACHQDILVWQPDVVILVDYGGFNLRVAKFIKDANIPVFYYISPKIWAWNTGPGEEDQAVGGSYVRDFPV